MPPPPHPGILFGVSLWRLVIVISAFSGFWLYYDGHAPNLTFLTQQGNLFTSIVYLVLLVYPMFTAGRRHEPNSPWIRGATTVLMILVGGTYLTMMSGSLEEPRDLLSHGITPLLVLIDWLFVGRNQQRSKWWHALTWPVFPLAYIVYYVAAGLDNYRFLDPEDSGFFGTILGFLLGLVAIGYVLYGSAKLKGAISRGMSGGPGHGPYGPPGGYPPGYGPQGPMQPGFPPGRFPGQPQPLGPPQPQGAPQPIPGGPPMQPMGGPAGPGQQAGPPPGRYSPPQFPAGPPMQGPGGQAPHR
ncbi:Pr6Pr family membrane protein [Actinoalloteichus hymeniacidonis]|uniref:Integral membrane protein n=1 Tax=Actinoalloteichus hymeniacidonis TaxID=340345 RepID=A0AAC9MXE5_9PSEU|nr:Pr6Pr family membrane protein [Actinoalloteichus hymeniacidonis]AOS62234.1 hypothetical protein TL08_07070 [Actinoalloteichus hymeniacidonis]MBB5909740.1 hypothetical protein [Actinoalloteichus hymeniacidonis]